MEKTRIKIPKKMAPNMAEEINPKSELKKGIPVSKVNATNRADPELIPNTYGPANGLLNKVCINIPLTASELPARMAMSIRGILNSKKITWDTLELLKLIMAS
jgi:hypothetical protein